MFGSATSVDRLGDGVYAAQLSEDWWVERGPNGGYLAAIVLRAMLEEIADASRAPRSLTLHYLETPSPGAVHATVKVERRGRSLATLSAQMTQEGRVVVLALAALSRDWPSERDFSSVEMPGVPAPSECPPRPEKGVPPIMQRYEMRLGVGGWPFKGGAEALTGGWLRPTEPEIAGPCLVAALTDAWFPAAFIRLDGPALLPTVDLTIHFRERLPLPGAQPGDWSLGVFRSRHARDGFVEEDAEIWSPDGRLLAQSRQLALMV